MWSYSFARYFPLWKSGFIRTWQEVSHISPCSPGWKKWNANAVSARNFALPLFHRRGVIRAPHRGQVSQ